MTTLKLVLTALARYIKIWKKESHMYSVWKVMLLFSKTQKRTKIVLLTYLEWPFSSLTDVNTTLKKDDRKGWCIQCTGLVKCIRDYISYSQPCLLIEASYALVELTFENQPIFLLFYSFISWKTLKRAIKG